MLRGLALTAIWAMAQITPPPGHPNGFMHAIAIDGRGDVLAQSMDGKPPHIVIQSFVWRHGTKRVLGDIGAVAMNGRGDVVGNAGLSAVLWRNGVTTALGPGIAVAVNDADTVAGNTGTHAFVWQNGTLTDLGEGTHAVAINEHGAVVGTNGSHAFLWQNGSAADLGAFRPVALNDAGVVLGELDTENGNPVAAVEWRNGALTRLAGPAQAVTINAAGDALVERTTASGNPLGAALFLHTGRVVEIPSLGNGPISVVGLSDRGEVLGFGPTPKHGRRSFVWQNGRTTILPTTDGVRPPWGNPVAINNRGQAVGDEYVDLPNGHGSAHVVLWTKR